MMAGLVGSSGIAAIPTTFLDLLFVQRLRRSPRFRIRGIELDAAVWSNNAMRLMARGVSVATLDLATATLSVGVVKRRVP